MKNKIIILGQEQDKLYDLCKRLNKNKLSNSVVIDLPQSCINDDLLKFQLFKLYYTDNNIDTIICDYKYLSSAFAHLFKNNIDTLCYLSIDEEKRNVKAICKEHKIVMFDFVNTELYEKLKDQEKKTN